VLFWTDGCWDAPSLDCWRGVWLVWSDDRVGLGWNEGAQCVCMRVRGEGVWGVIRDGVGWVLVSPHSCNFSFC